MRYLIPFSMMLAGVGLVLVVGCAPTTFGEGEFYYADQYHVRDAAARRVEGYWFLRFDLLALSDLDDAIEAEEQGHTQKMRQTAERVLRAATSLAQTTAQSEIARMPVDARRQLAKLAGTDASTEALSTAYRQRAQKALDALLTELAGMSDDTVVAKLSDIRAHVEQAVDDQGRSARQLVFGFGALPAWLGIEQVEADMKAEHAQEVTYEQAVVWIPKVAAGSQARDAAAGFGAHAPEIVMESPKERNYPAQYDRFGEVYLTGTPQQINVNINISRPVMYTYTSEAKIHGERYRQHCYAWWYPHRPEMQVNDAVAGRIDGDTLRVTLGHDGRPAIFEVIQSCGCGHLVYVGKHVEDRALKQYGQPQPGKKLAIEKDVAGHRDLVVMGTIEVPEKNAHPVVYATAGYHSVLAVTCVSGLPLPDLDVVEQYEYTLRDYGVLDRLPLGDGVASMFGPDGLVHNAGRREGYLLAPTGMLSAGQPRKRGTQRIRWDEYSFDDPELLDKALRLPDAF